jgi:hypothetical protein
VNRRRLLGLLTALVLSGCGGGTYPITLDFSNSTTTPSVGSGYNAPVGTVMDVPPAVVLTSSAGGANLRVSLDAPSTGEVSVGDRHLTLEYTLGTGTSAAGWASNAGSITITSLAPYDVTFQRVEMIAATPSATGAFFLSGTAKFSK